MASAIIEAVDLITTVWDIASILKGTKAPSDNQVSVNLIVGDANNGGGSVPHVAVWIDNGNRVGQFKGKENGHIDEGTVYPITINNDQNGDNPAKPSYLSVVMQESDAICLSAIIASGNGAQYTWTGDMAKTCGGQWYNSDFAFGSSNNPPRCMWMDADHSDNIIAKGLGMHMPDFAPDSGLVAQYNANKDRLCKNTARMTFLVEPTVPDSMLKFFKTPPAYHRSGETAKDVPEGTDSGGALVDPDAGIDRKNDGFPDGTNMKITKERRHARQIVSREAASAKHDKAGPTKAPKSKTKSAQATGTKSGSAKPKATTKQTGKGAQPQASKNGTAKAGTKEPFKKTGLKNLRPTHLTISDIKSQKATELCEHPLSLGPDFVSTVEKRFCDMATGKVWPLCDGKTGSGCFDLDTKQMKQGKKRDAQPVPQKAYKSQDHWKGTRKIQG